MSKTAEFWRRLAAGEIRCELCPHHCRLREGQTGLCHVRTVRGGELHADAYGMVSSAHLDPIEKKPLYHFRPGSEIFSVGGWGCNFACEFCQNWTISQAFEAGGPSCSPDRVVAEAERSGSGAIAYTYNEPLVGFEFVRDCSEAAKAADLANVLVTNGYVEREPAAALLPLVSAVNVDIKSMDEEFYRRRCRGRLAPVLAFCVQAREAGCHVEITNLLIPGLNDSPGQVERLAEWVRERLGEHTPLHLSAYRPEYRMEIPATPPESLEAAYAVCVKHLSYVYLGNVLASRGQNTNCPGCGRELVARSGYATRITGLRGNACAGCGRKAEVILSRKFPGAGVS